LKNLLYLDLRGNQLTSLPPEVAQLTDLSSLDLRGNQLTSLPPDVAQLKNLLYLDLRGNQLSSLPPEVAKLTNLQGLDLSWNQLTSLPPEVGQLTNLQVLDLRRNQLSSLPPAVAQLTNLRWLDLSGNQLSSLPPAVAQLTNLRQLWLSGNQLTSLPPEIGQLLHLRELDVKGNPLTSPPPEIVKQGMDAVRSYFASLEVEEFRVLNEVKVILVGDGGAGKTSLVKRLLRDEFDEGQLQTKGVEIDDWEVNTPNAEICAHLWDFGGQVIMHSTHQFFLSKRSLYVLVLDGRKEEEPEYWLKHIESFGGDSPILVVLNKMDENPGFDVNRRFLQEKYEGIAKFFRVSCRSGKGIPALRSALENTLTKVEITSTKWPANWFKAKQQLEKMEKSFISDREYAGLCKDVDVGKAGDRETLIKFLHDLGVIVHFPDFELKHMHVLNPLWLTTAVYRIVNSETLAEGKGILKLSSLGDILASEGDGYDYPGKEHPFIVCIMEKFELCFRIDKKRILIPDLLQVQEPKIDFDFEASLRFRLDYDFLPKSIIPRFMVKKHKEIKGELRWRTGVVLKSDVFAATAVIRADVAAKRIYIFVNGRQRRDYLTVLRSVFLEINKSFEKLEYKERIPLPDDPEVAVPFDHLVNLENMGISEFVPEGSAKKYRVKELFGTVYVEGQPTIDDFFRLLQQLVKDSEEDKAIAKKAEGIFILQPNFYGLGLDMTRIAAKFKKWREARRR